MVVNGNGFYLNEFNISFAKVGDKVLASYCDMVLRVKRRSFEIISKPISHEFA